MQAWGFLFQCLVTSKREIYCLCFPFLANALQCTVEERESITLAFQMLRLLFNAKQITLYLFVGWDYRLTFLQALRSCTNSYHFTKICESHLIVCWILFSNSIEVSTKGKIHRNEI